ncbi:Hypothetical predicted protein, partial [Paramuricea clavata]
MVKFLTCSPENDPSDGPEASKDAASPTCDSVASHLMTDPLEGEPGTEDDVVDKESRASSITTEEDSPLEHGTSTETIDQEESVETNHADIASSESSVTQEEYVSTKGVRFTPPEAHKE